MSYERERHMARCFVRAGAGGPIDAGWCTASYADVLVALPPDLGPADIERDDLLLYRDGKISIYLTPFDECNTSARIALVGLTPGRHQLHLALNTAAAALREGHCVNEAVTRAKARAAFAGRMRTNLITMLDGIGLHDALGLPTCASLFAERRHLVLK